MKKKHKILKTFSFTSLALLMGIAGTMAFAPLGASPSVAGASEVNTSYETEQGLITPKADDPVIYTTESGLEIKWGNALPSTYNGSLSSSGSLEGFPYFTTTDGTNTYDWVIIGQALDIATVSFCKSIGEVIPNFQALLGIWSTYFFNNIYGLDSSPAGVAVDNEIMVNHIVDTIGVSDEIPSGCVLVLANTNVATGVYNTSSAGYYDGSSGTYYKRYNYHSVYANNIRTVMDGYYTNSSFGISSIKSNIVPVTLVTYGLTGTTTGSASFTGGTATLTDKYIYPLGGRSEDTFYIRKYLSAREASSSTYYWLRGGTSTNYTSVDSKPNRYYYVSAHAIGPDGNVSTGVFVNNSGVGYRPAFCLKIT